MVTRTHSGTAALQYLDLDHRVGQAFVLCPSCHGEDTQMERVECPDPGDPGGAAAVVCSCGQCDYWFAVVLQPYGGRTLLQVRENVPRAPALLAATARLHAKAR